MLDLKKIFTFHPAKPEQVPRYEAIRAAGLVFAEAVTEMCPDSRERSVALTNIQQAVMWANASIAINESAGVPG